MISRLRFPTGNSNAAGTTSTSIFGGSLTGGNSVTPGSSAERAAAAAAANVASNSSSVTGTDELPSGWRLISSRQSGRDYYLHVASGQTQWEKPTEAEPKRTSFGLPVV